MNSVAPAPGNTMPISRPFIPMVFILLLIWAIPAIAQDTTFTYQGELLQSGLPADGQFDFQVLLFESDINGVTIAPDEVFINKPVNGGLFQLDLNFGDAILLDTQLWLEIRVRAAGQTDFTVLMPRERVTAAPRAALAQIADFNAVNSASIVDASITDSKLAADAVGASELAFNSVGTNQIQAAAVSSSHIQANAVRRDQIAAASVGAEEIAPGSVGTTHIASRAVGASELAPASVGTSELSTNAIGAAEIAPGAVSGNAIQSGAVGTGEIADGAVRTPDINQNEVQRRGNFSCVAGSAIRTINATGFVGCEVDSRGISGFGSPIQSQFASSFNGAGSNTQIVGSVASALCTLGSVDLGDLDGTNEVARCRLFIANGNWVLEAFSSPGFDNDAVCTANCQSIFRSP